jgi:RHS repeat-associated protein
LAAAAFPSNGIVLDANLQLYLQSSLNSTPAQLSLFKATTNWVTPPGVPQNTTWNTAQQSTSWTTPGGDMGAGSVNTAPTTVSTAGQSYNWRFTQLVQRWLDGQDPNYGVFLKGDPEGTTNVFHFSSNGDINNMPQLLVTYEYAIGDRALYTYDRQSLDDRLGTAVNLGTGNLMLSANDLHIAGTGLDEYIGRFFNSLGSGFDTNGSGDFNYQWQMGTGNDVYFKFYADGSAAYYGPSGYAVPFVRLANGDYASPTALDATLAKNANGTYTLTAHGDSVAQNFDANGRLTSIVDPNGNQLTFNYTANGASGNGYVLSSIVDAQGRTTSFAYNTSAQLTQITDPASRLYKYAYSPTNGSLITYTDPNNKVTRFGWTNGALTSVTDPNNNVTSFTYNLNNQVTKITRGSSNWQYTYNAGSTVATDPDGHTQTYSFDGLGRVTKIVDGLGHTTFNSPSTGNLYNDDSQLLSFTNGLGGTSSFGYETNNESRNSSRIPTQATSSWEYHNAQPFNFYPTKYTDPQNNIWNYSYDSHGDLLSQQETGQAPVSFTYNANGTIATATNGNGHTTAYGYDTNGNLTTITPPAPLGQTTLTYDSVSRIATVKDGKNQTTTYTYDGLDRVTKITYNDNSTVTYVYDANGNLASQADASGTDTFAFDSKNRLMKETLPNTKTNTYTYDLAGNLATFADAGGTVTYNYDSANELSSLTDPNGKQTTFNYDNDHNRTQINYPNGVAQFTTYDNSNRITSIIGKKVASGTVLTSLSYTYASGIVDTALRQSVIDNVAGATTTYGYDYANRLDSAVSPSASYQYTYDADGNRLTSTVNGVTTNASYNNADELTQNGVTTFTSDADGNLLNTSSSLALTYNPKNQTTTAGSTGFNYLGAGQTQRTAAGSTSFQNNALGLGYETGSSGSTYFTRTPDGALISERAPAPTSTQYYLTDAIGSTIALTESTGSITNTYKYEPYGKQLASSTGSTPNPFRFAGEYFDSATGLYKIGARYYDTTLGRWTSTDPMASVVNDHGGNGYSYADGDPTNIVDPTGLTGDRGWTGPQCANINAVSQKWAFAHCPAIVYCSKYSCVYHHTLAWWERCANEFLEPPGLTLFSGTHGISKYMEHHALADVGKTMGKLGLVADAATCGVAIFIHD